MALTPLPLIAAPTATSGIIDPLYAAFVAALALLIAIVVDTCRTYRRRREAREALDSEVRRVVLAAGLALARPFLRPKPLAVAEVDFPPVPLPREEATVHLKAAA